MKKQLKTIINKIGHSRKTHELMVILVHHSDEILKIIDLLELLFK